jgi:hypothetical protein
VRVEEVVRVRIASVVIGMNLQGVSSGRAMTTRVAADVGAKRRGQYEASGGRRKREVEEPLAHGAGTSAAATQRAGVAYEIQMPARVEAHTTGQGKSHGANGSNRYRLMSTIPIAERDSPTRTQSERPRS